MNVVVCVKQVPDTSDPDTEVHIDSSGKGVDESKFSFVINDADNYAVEEAILLKEKHGGEVTVVSMGPESANQVIKMALAKGGDTAVRLDDEKFAYSDVIAVAQTLKSAIEGQEYDIIMTGCIASDDGFSAVGVALAEMLGIPHAAMVKHVEVVDDKKLKVGRELEGGLQEMIEIETPCLLTIQTGTNEPRYASFKGIRQASKKEIKVMDLGATGLSEDQVGEAGSRTIMAEYSVPEVGELAEILKGEPAETSGKLADILKEKGLV
ncbi:MAG: electron transfer flavoprotein subunit beta/FixA family protein [Actinobacteria bacterium]|nr:electron transfer flavoprotein subunit beta/FixA family protein [Actinomycetota bacterium]